MNGHATRQLRRGVYCALPCFFDANENLDVQAFLQHLLYVVKGGCYPVISGSMGEAIHLTSEERCTLIRESRKALDAAGFGDVSLLVGAGATSTRATIKLVKEAAEAGADQVMVILDGYYAGLLKSYPQAIKQHFIEVAAASPVPVMLYNFPAVTAGIDLSHDLVEDIAREAPNTCGIKLTCANVGKLTRLAAVVQSREFQKKYPRKDRNAPFLLLDGQIDILLATMPVGAGGCIGGVPNFAPLVCAKLWELCTKELEGQALSEARELQAIVARADYFASGTGIPGMKWVLNALFGYGIAPRRPLPVMGDADGKNFRANLAEILDLESQLAKES